MDKEFLKEYSCIIGCDEVGRGPIAGPVNACAVKIIDTKTVDQLLKFDVTDSKKLSLKKRKVILDQLQIDVSKIQLNKKYIIKNPTLYFEFCVTQLDADEIDKINILQASLAAMKNASDRLVSKDSKILIDGNKTFQSKVITEAIVKGDSKCVSIGLASIIAKVFRDEKMIIFDQEFPGYMLAKNAGYPTKEHKDAVKRLGPCLIHRKTFKGVKEYI